MKYGGSFAYMCTFIPNVLVGYRTFLKPAFLFLAWLALFNSSACDNPPKDAWFVHAMGKEKGLLPSEPKQPLVQVEFPQYVRTDFYPHKFPSLKQGTMLAGDFNQDQKLDVVMASFDEYTGQEKIVLFVGKDQWGGFEAPKELSLKKNPRDPSVYPYAMVLQDVDADSHLDIVIGSKVDSSSDDWRIHILWGDGLGNFQLQEIPCKIDRFNHSQLVVEKLHVSDRFPSILWKSQSIGYTLIAEHTGMRNFLPVRAPFFTNRSGETIQERADDLDHDGHLDFLRVVRLDFAGSTRFFVVVTQSDGKGNYSEFESFRIPDGVEPHDFIDLDQDGTLDLLVSAFYEDEKGVRDPNQKRLLVWKGLPIGQYRKESPLLNVVVSDAKVPTLYSYLPQMDIKRCFFKDLDSNGIPELLIYSASRILILQRDQKGEWTLDRVLNKQEELGLYDINTVIPYDVDLDGNFEILTYSQAGVLNILKQDKKASTYFVSKQMGQFPIELGPIVAMPSDARYVQEKKVPEVRIFDQKDTWMYQLRNGDIPLFWGDHFLRRKVKFGFSVQSAASESEFMALLGRRGMGIDTLYLYKNCYQTSDFDPLSCNLDNTIPLTTIKGPKEVQLVDLNRDEQKDILLTASDGVYLLSRNGLNFTQPRLLPLDSPPKTEISSVKVADLNQDGWLDLILTLPTERRVAVFLWDHDGKQWSSSSFIEMDQDIGEVLITQVNIDKYPDVVVSEALGGKVHFYYTKEDGQLTKLLDPIELGSPIGGMALAHLNQDQFPDFVVTLPEQNAIRLIMSRKDGAGFFAMTPLPTGQRPTNVVVTEKTKDCEPFIYVVNKDSGTISAFVLPKLVTDSFPTP